MHILPQCTCPRPPAAGAHKAAAHKAHPGTGQGAAGPLHKGAAPLRQDAPSFASSAFASKPAVGSEGSGGLFSRLLGRLRPAAAPPAHASDAMPAAPSFAAAPLLRERQRDAGGVAHAAAAPNATLAAARQLAAQAARSAAGAVSPATAANPLYRFAKLGSRGQEPGASPAASAAAKEGLGALKRYTDLPAQQAAGRATRGEAAAAGTAAKRVAQKALDAKALLRYAKLK